MPPHELLAPPWNLRGNGDDTVAGLLAEEDYLLAEEALEDHWPDPAEPRLHVLRAHVAFQHGLEGGLTERVSAARRALADLTIAAQADVPLADFAPLQESIEEVLAAETVAELKLERFDPQTATIPELADAAERIGAVNLPKSAEWLLVAAERDLPARKHLHEMSAGRVLHRNGELARSRPLLERVSDVDWRRKELWDLRLFGEGAWGDLLESAEDSRTYESLWKRALAWGASVDLAFPSAWDLQERLLGQMLVRKQGARAAWLGSRIESERDYVSRAVTAKILEARALARQQASTEAILG